MKSLQKILSVAILGCICSGCLKLEHNITSPGARGVVLDARTHSPLSGAQVVMSRMQFWSNSPIVLDALTNTRPPVLTTGKDGRFHLPPEGHWNLVVDYLIAPLHTPDGTLVVQRAGYEPAAVQIWGDIVPLSSHPTNFVEIFLTPVTSY